MPIDPSTAFVSYAREDLEFALRLARDLKAKGAKVWMDKLDILPGQSWDDKVEIAVEHCGRMLVVLSPQSVASTKVKNEFMDALDQGKVVIPVFFRDCKVPQQLKRLQYADFRSDHAVGLEELLASLSSDQELTVEGDVPGAAPESPPAETYVEWRLRELQGRAEVGDTAAMVDLADAYLDGNGVSKDISQAIFWYRKAADAGNTAGMGKLALKYMFGEGVEQDDGQAAGWFRRAADLGDSFAMFNLAHMYELGQGVELDYGQARKWYTQARSSRPQDVEAALDRIKMKEAVERARRAEEEQKRQAAVEEAREEEERKLAAAKKGPIGATGTRPPSSCGRKSTTGGGGAPAHRCRASQRGRR